LLTTASLLSGGLYYLGRSIFVSVQLTGVGYTSHFIFELDQILNSLVRWGGWMLRDYTWLAPLGVIVIVFCLASRRWPASGMWWFGVVWMAAWLGLYLPWYFAVEYYLLPFAAGAAVLAGVLFIETASLLKHASLAWRTSGAAALGLSGLLLLGSLANNAASASVQLAQDAANAGVLAYVAENASWQRSDRISRRQMSMLNKCS
jgi:4-amino-4-deoxy-L-arabinose transferase-like glycosyltransferase